MTKTTTIRSQVAAGSHSQGHPLTATELDALIDARWTTKK